MKNGFKFIGLLLWIINQNISAVNSLNKVELHKKKFGPELGTLSLYFSQKPAYNFKKIDHLQNQGEANSSQALSNVLIFSFPATVKSEQINASLTQLADEMDPLYRISFNQDKNGLHLSIIFNASKIDINVHDFDSIKKQKGINITFINKELIKQIDQKSKKMILTTAHNKKPTIAVDCGHGGKDSGAYGFLGKAEKELTLDIGKQVAHFLHEKGFQVVLTRSHDVDVSLGKRTTIANYIPADIFLSIHANASEDKKKRGIETYCLRHELFSQGFSTLDTKSRRYLAQLEKNRCDFSNKLAQNIHTKTIQAVICKNPMSDRHVKSAVTQVLLGTGMPAALIEIGFISNEQEAKLLYDKQYQQLLAHGICNGIISYIDSVKIA